MNNITDKDFWKERFKGVEYKPAGELDPIRNLILKYFSNGLNKSCIEIGCYPGGYLATFGELGYELNGIDFSDELPNMINWLNSNNYKTGKFWQEDFLTFDPAQKFDVVSSFGFLEHFTNWQEIFNKHIKFINEEGYLLLTVPNFVGSLQKFIHKTYDRENYNAHHIPSMNLKKWKKILRNHGFNIVFSGYFRKFDFWVMHEPKNNLKELPLKILFKYHMILKKYLPANIKMYSPYIGIVAKKQNNILNKSI